MSTPGEPRRADGEGEDFLSLSPRVRVIPVVHASGDFAQEARDRLLRLEPDCLAVPLPPSFEEAVEAIVSGWRSSLILPVTIRDTSRRSSIKWAWRRALRSMTSNACRRRSSGNDPVRNIDSHPNTALRGVRSSCDSVARNSSFERSAS